MRAIILRIVSTALERQTIGDDLLAFLNSDRLPKRNFWNTIRFVDWRSNTRRGSGVFHGSNCLLFTVIQITFCWLSNQ